jgi:hypothetical protein
MLPHSLNAGTLLPRLIAVGLMAVLFFAAGCAEEPSQYTGVRRVDERLTPRDLNQLVSIVQALPGRKLPPFPSLVVPPPNWKADRSLPINQLAAEERQDFARRTTPANLVAALEQSPHLQRLLRREQLTCEQFAGLILSAGAAFARSEIPDEVDLDAAVARGLPVLAALEANPEVYSLLAARSREEMHAVQRASLWLAVVDRAAWLKSVPPQNVELARSMRDQLMAVLPPEFLTNLLSDLMPVIEDHGVPFRERPGLSDERISWSRAMAIIGTDSDPSPPPPANVRPMDVDMDDWP